MNHREPSSRPVQVSRHGSFASLIHGESRCGVGAASGGATPVPARRGKVIHRESRRGRGHMLILIHHESSAGESHHSMRSGTGRGRRNRCTPSANLIHRESQPHRRRAQPRHVALLPSEPETGRSAGHTLAPLDRWNGSLSHARLPIHRESAITVNRTTTAAASTPSPRHLTTPIHDESTPTKEGSTQ